MKTALYQGVGRLIRGVFSRGRAFLAQTERLFYMLRGEGAAQIVPSCVYWGGVYPDTPEVGDSRGGRGQLRHRMPHTREHSR